MKNIINSIRNLFQQIMMRIKNIIKKKIEFLEDNGTTIIALIWTFYDIFAIFCCVRSIIKRIKKN